MILEENYTLSNGVEIPKLGLGTWLISNADVVEAVLAAVKIGYRHIDTAQAYGNESGVGDGIRASGVKKEDMFVTTKLAAEVKSYKEAVASLRRNRSGHPDRVHPRDQVRLDDRLRDRHQSRAVRRPDRGRHPQRHQLRPDRAVPVQ